MSNDIMTAAAELAVIVPEIWSQKQYEVLLDSFVFMDSVDRNYEGEIQDLGDTVNIHSVPEFDEALLLSEGAAGDAEAVTLTQNQLIVNSRPYKDVIITKKGQLQSLPFMDDLRDKMVHAIMKKMESLIVAATIPSASNPDHQIAYDSGSVLALADILEVKDLLDAQNVPKENRKAAIDSLQINDLFNITGFVSRDFIPAGSPLTEGAINTPVVGFEILEATTLVTDSYWFHPSYLTAAIQQSLNVETLGLGVNGIRGTRINADLLFGFKQLDNTRVVKLS